MRSTFAYADRRCRLFVPSARDLFLRAQSHKSEGRLEAARDDLAAALSLDPTDLVIDRAALAWGDPEMRREAAERIIARAGAGGALRLKALAVLFEAGARVAHRLSRSAQGVSGWIAWAGSEPLRIVMARSEEPLVFIVDPDADHPLATAGTAAADVEIEVDDTKPLVLELRAADGEVERVEPAWTARPKPRKAPIRPQASAQGQADFVTIVVPVYEDYGATRACLESLAQARPACAHRILVVDDASPNVELRAWLDAAAARGEFELLRNETNLGFARAVNIALAQVGHGDALLLNADTLLPPGAIDRLRALSRSRPEVGTVTPFSNNGELTSYPVRNEANPLPLPVEVAALDALARRINGDALVDLPNGIGFCLYIKDACLDAVGGLPEIYAQGYYEDVEFCLAARERGFRNVAAPGVYVGHAGSKSFAARKRALVVRNLQLIETRFPGYRLETAAFVALDPLKPYRAALDAAAPPRGPVIVVASGPGAAATLAGRRAKQRRDQQPEATVVTMVATARGRTVALAAEGELAPQSLTFDFDRNEEAALRAYLGRLDVTHIDLLDPASLPDAALSALLDSHAEIDLMCGDLAWFSTLLPSHEGRCATAGDALPCESCRSLAASASNDPQRLHARRLKLGRALERAARVVPLDRLADSFAQRVFKTRARRWEGGPPPSPTAASSPLLRLGALYPHRAPDVERLLLRLGQRLAAQEGELVVFGASLDDAALMAAGGLFVTGPVAPQDYGRLASDYGLDALIAPDRGGGFGDLETAAAALGAPKAYFDWSFGGFPVEWGDLSLDPRICDDKAVTLIVAWMDGERRP